MGVDFRRADTSMAEHLLYCEQVGAAFKQMGCETVAEGVRADALGDAVLFGEVFHDEEDHLSGEARAAAVQKHGVGEFGLHVDVQSGALDVLEQDFQAAVADGYKPFLAALAEDAQEAVFAINVADL